MWHLVPPSKCIGELALPVQAVRLAHLAHLAQLAQRQAAMALAAALATPGHKRAHEDINNDGDGVGDDNSQTEEREDDSDGFQLFVTRYSKRLRQHQHNKSPSLAGPADKQPHQLHLQKTGSNGGGRGGGRQQRQGQQRTHLQQLTGKSKSNSDTNTSLQHRAQIYEEAIETAVSQANQPEQLSDELSCLKAELVELHQQITTLTNQVSFLLSFAGITDGQLTSSTTNDQSTDHPSGSYASVAARNVHLIHGPIREAMLTAVHSDLQLKQSRSKNIVVSGLPPNDDYSDRELFVELCQVEFGICPTVTHVKRLGKSLHGRLQPLLVCLQGEDEANQLLSLARMLRHSTDVYAANHVYLTAHQTRAERQAAFEMRCQRRQRVSARSTQQHHQEKDELQNVEMVEDSAGHTAPTTATTNRGDRAAPAARWSAGRCEPAVRSNLKLSSPAPSLALGVGAAMATAARAAASTAVESSTAQRPSLFTVSQLQRFLQQARMSDSQTVSVSFSTSAAAADAAADGATQSLAADSSPHTSAVPGHTDQTGQ